MPNKLLYLILLLSGVLVSACHSGASSTNPTPTPAVESNLVAIVVGNGNVYNIPSIALTVCQPNTTICQTFDKILLDTGSIGLKINQSAFSSVNLPTINQTGSNLPISVCNLYGSGYVFATANYADVYIGGEKASNLPIQIIDDGDQSNVPASCTNQGAQVDFIKLGYNGIIGVNPMVNFRNNSNYNYTCSNGSCSGIIAGYPVPHLNVNPVSAFGQDNNGEVISLPAVSPYSESPVYGTMIFGLNTKANNQLPTNVNGLRGDPNDGIGRFWGYSSGVPFYTLYDTGTNYLNFYSDEIQACYDGNFYFYCPDSTVTWNSFVFNYDGNGEPYFIEMPIGPVAYAGYPVAPQFAIYTPEGFGLYGLPFFLGRNVYIGFIGNNSSMGSGPTWGYINH